MKKLLLVLAAAVTLGGCNRLDNHQPLTVKNLTFAFASSISQTFYSRHNGVNRVDICLRNRDRVLLPLRFSLYLAGSTTAIRTLDFSGGNIDNQDCTRFQFAPVADSADKEYRAEIAVLPPQSDVLPEDFMHTKDSLSIEANGGGDYPQGAAYLDNKVTEYDLHFKSYYEQSAGDAIRESLAQLGARLTQDPAFIVVYIIALAVLVRGLARKAHAKVK